MTTICTRFAPSPTGHLHVGGVRTALYSWLYARKHNGQFILRIEDTDLERSTEASMQAILGGMEWLGLTYDKGPYFQMQRMSHYKEVIQHLLAESKVYRCTCSKERLEALREQQMANKQKPRYDGRCRDLNLTEDCGEAFVLRFKTPTTGSIVIDDQVRGRVEFQNSELDDLIIARSDGTPTYNFTVVVDDSEMEVTHVVRGDDHLNNTARQINIFHALGKKEPVYAHVPMILGDDGKRLSKRHGAVSVMEYHDLGILPEALLNYLVRLGWSYGDQEIFSIDEMIALFDIKDINKSASAFNTEKLLWLNQHYIKTLPVERVAEQLQWHLDKAGYDMANGPTAEEIVHAQHGRCKTLKEMAEKSYYFYQDSLELDEKAARKHLTLEIKPALTFLLSEFSKFDDWQKSSCHQVILNIAEKLELKLGKVAQPVRVAITGNTVSPPLDITLHMIGQERTLKHLRRALDYIADLEEV